MPIQASLKVNAPGDKYEQEAERTADHVMSAPDSAVQRESYACGRSADPDGLGDQCQQEQMSQQTDDVQRQDSGATPTPAVGQTLCQPGRPLDGATRNFMESRFGQDFGQVRVHADGPAADSAEAVNSRAYTHGRDIVFNNGQYRPHTAGGRQLLAHELTHVVQQRGRQGLIQRQSTVPGGGATPGVGTGIDLIFVIKAPDDQFTRDITHYAKTVLEGQTVVEVENLDELFAYLATLRSQKGSTIWEKAADPDKARPDKLGTKVRRIRIVAHGSTSGDVKLTPKGEKKRRWFSPKEVEAYAGKAAHRKTIFEVLTPDAVVEFWGCNIGGVDEATQAWSELFRRKFSATSETFKTNFDKYYRTAGRGEKGEKIEGHKGRFVQVTNSSQVDSRGKALRRHFRKWLLDQYKHLVANGDIVPVKGEAEQVKYMRKLFDRANGEIRNIVIEKHDDGSKVRPGDQAGWKKLWKSADHLNIWEKAAQAK